MKLKLTLLLLAAISTLQAGAFKLADITTPTKKACSDIACVLGNHSGKLALTTGVIGVLMYRHADIELQRVAAHRKAIQDVRVAVLYANNDSEVVNYSKELQNATSEYRDARTRLDARESRLGIGSAQARVKFAQRNHKTLPKNFSEAELKRAQAAMEQTEQDLKAIEADRELQELRHEVSTLEDALRESFKQEELRFNTRELQDYYTRLWYCGVCIALASAISYSMYKAYPKLQKWYSAYVNQSVANAA